jgi:ubiquitin-like protein Pup
MAQDKQRADKREETQAEELPARPQDEELSADVDSILDEIDVVLEPNAEEFVSQYVQKGGE